GETFVLSKVDNRSLETNGVFTHAPVVVEANDPQNFSFVASNPSRNTSVEDRYPYSGISSSQVRNIVPEAELINLEHDQRPPRHHINDNLRNQSYRSDSHFKISPFDGTTS
ncbi:unnamed protein product, partial [Owenia fusiformis]